MNQASCLTYVFKFIRFHVYICICILSQCLVMSESGSSRTAEAKQGPGGGQSGNSTWIHSLIHLINITWLYYRPSALLCSGHYNLMDATDFIL